VTVEAAPAAAERRRLIETYLPLVDRVARRHARSGEGADDLAQVGALALVRAIDRRDPERPGTLARYVSLCVEGEIRRHLRDHGGAVRVPRDARDFDDPRVATARRPLLLTEDDVVDGADSLDDLALPRALVARAARALDHRERRILLLRFFLDRTQDEVADELGLSQAHVSRLIEDALAKMRVRLERGDALYRVKRRATLEPYGLERRAGQGDARAVAQRATAAADASVTARGARQAL
jgi:RNA polymerase sigma-B factor